MASNSALHNAPFLSRHTSVLDTSFDEQTLLATIMGDSLLAGKGRLLFPLQHEYWSGNCLSDLHMRWYMPPNATECAAAINTLRTQAAEGKTFFLELYSEEEKAADPSKQDTGLFFFQGAEYGSVSIHCAGGDFSYVGSMADSIPHAYELSQRGYNAFVLIYRPPRNLAEQDLARAIALLHERAAELKLGIDTYSLWGGSAGARLVAWLASHGTELYGEPSCPPPSLVVTAYTSLPDVYGNEPPTYAIISKDDTVSTWQSMQARIEALKAQGTPCRLRLVEGLDHGFGTGIGTIAEGWIDEALAFWREVAPHTIGA